VFCILHVVLHGVQYGTGKARHWVWYGVEELARGLVGRGTGPVQESGCLGLAVRCCVFSLFVKLLFLFPLFAVLLNCPYPDPPVSTCFFFFHSPPHVGGGRGFHVSLLLPAAAEIKTAIQHLGGYPAFLLVGTWSFGWHPVFLLVGTWHSSGWADSVSFRGHVAFCWPPAILVGTWHFFCWARCVLVASWHLKWAPGVSFNLHLVFWWPPGLLVGTQHFLWWPSGIFLGMHYLFLWGHVVLVVTWHLGVHPALFW